jgi:hypothetical protein
LRHIFCFHPYTVGPNQLQLFEEAIAHIDDYFTASSSSSTLGESQSAAQKLKSSSLALVQLANLFESSQQYASGELTCQCVNANICTITV